MEFVIGPYSICSECGENIPVWKVIVQYHFYVYFISCWKNSRMLSNLDTVIYSLEISFSTWIMFLTLMSSTLIRFSLDKFKIKNKRYFNTLYDATRGLFSS